MCAGAAFSSGSAAWGRGTESPGLALQVAASGVQSFPCIDMY